MPRLSSLGHALILLLVTAHVSCSQVTRALKSTWHEKFNWKAEDYFDDPQVIALCQAIEANDLEEIDRLVAAGADVNAKGKHNMTPLLWAYPDNKLPRFKRLLEHGADPNVIVQDDFGTRMTIHPGHAVTLIAAQTHFDGYLEAVLQHGGDPNLVDSNGKETPLFKVIIGAGRDKRKRIQLLIDKGADLNPVSGFGGTPTMQAVTWGGQYALALMLLEAGADHRVYRTDGLNRLVHVVIRAERRLPNCTPEQKADYYKLVDWLVEHGEDFDEARADIKRWRSWVGPPRKKKELREQEIAARKERERREREAENAENGEPTAQEPPNADP